MKRILVVIPGLSGGGAEKVARLLVSHQVSHFEIHILTFSAEKLPNKNIFLHQIKKRKGIFDALSLTFEIYRLIKRVHFVGIVSHLTYTNTVTAIAAYLTNFRGRVILVHHIVGLPDYSKLFNLVVQWAYKKYTVVAVSLEIRQSLIGRIKKLNNCVVIENPIQFPDSSHCSDFRREKFSLLAIGRYSPQKNYPFMFRMLSMLPMPYTLTVFGSGDREKFQRLATEMNIESRITLNDFVDFKSLQIAYCKAGCFIMTSDYEGEPLALLEAASLGIPVLGRATPGLRSALERVGGLMPDLDTEHEFKELVLRVKEQASPRSAAAEWMQVHTPSYASHRYCILIQERVLFDF